MRQRLSDSVCLTAIAMSVVMSEPALAQDNSARSSGAPDRSVSGSFTLVPSAAPHLSPAQSTAADIIVTGSRLARRDYSAPSPIVTLPADTLKQTGGIGVESIMDQLPQFTGSFNGTTAFPGNAGQSNLNLRGLGTNRVLILLNGHRLQPTSPDGTVDVNVIPTALLQNVETITGGASATYGSDAVAGVVNFKLNNHFTGLQLDAKMGVTGRGDGGTAEISITGGSGFNDNRGSALFSFSYADRNGISRGARDYFPSDLSQYNGRPVFGALTVIPQGVANLAASPPSQAAVNTVFAKYGVAPGLVSPTDSFGINSNGTLFNALPTNRPVQNFLGGNNQYSAVYNNGVYANTSPRIDLQLPLTRWSGFARTDYELADTITAFAQGYYVDYKVKRHLPEDPIGGISGAITVPVTNPFIPDDLRTLLASRATPGARFPISKGLVQFPNRVETNHYAAWQALAGLQGELVGAWKWDITGSYGINTLRQTQGGSVNRTLLQGLIDAPDGGAGICSGGFNPFGNAATSSQCIGYLEASGINHTRLTQLNFEGNIRGDLLNLPAGPLQVAIGADYRRNSYRFTPDPLVATGNLVGYAAARASEGAQNVTEGYVELLVPLLTNQPLFEKLALGLAYRYSSYDTSGTTSTYRADLEWQVGGGVSLRGGYSRAVRAPSLLELFGAPSVATVTIGTPSAGSTNGDPCDVRSQARQGPASAQVQAICVAQGVPAAGVAGFTQSSVAATVESSGNQDLKPEAADTYTAGLVWNGKKANISPFLDGLSVSVDYYYINIRKAIGAVPLTQSLLRCFNYDSSNPTYSPSNVYCSYIRRQPGTGLLVVPSLQPLLNLASYRTSGIDFQADWTGKIDEDWRLNLNFIGTYVQDFKVGVLNGAPIVDYVGSTSNGAANGPVAPRFKSVATVSLGNPQVNASLKWRYISHLKDASRLTNLASTTPGVPSVSYFDANFSAHLQEGFTLALGVTNVADKKPPIVGGILGNFDYATYDVLGRSFYANIRARF